MKKVMLVLLIVVFSFGIVAGDKPPYMPKKPPGTARVEIVNKSGEKIYVSLVGVGYDFRIKEFVTDWGGIPPSRAYVQIEGTKTISVGGKTYVLRLPEVTKTVHVFKDLYAISVTYQQEADGEGVCMNNWTPQKLADFPAFYAAQGNNSRLVVRACDKVPANLGKSADGTLKWNRFGVLLHNAAYFYKHSQYYK